MSLVHLSATELLAAYAEGTCSSREAVDAYLQRIEQHDATYGTFLELYAEKARAEAEQIDRRRAAGESLGALAGVPVAIKDLICIAGERTTCGSRMLEQFVAPYDATVIERLKGADAILLGKTNLDEFAMGGATEYSAFQATRNPWHTDHTPGGSSGGAAAAVAADFAPLSLGTDTGGSIRQPAAYCGVAGLKPTYGRVSRYGLIAFASSLDQIGPLARTAEDLALLLSVIGGPDPRDSTSSPESLPAFDLTLPANDQPLRGWRIGRVREIAAADVAGELKEAVNAATAQLVELGAEVVDVSLPHLDYGVATYYVIAPCEASSNLARYDGMHYGHRPATATSLTELYARARSEGFGPEVKRRIMLGTFALSSGYYDAYYKKALQVRRLIRDDYRRVFSECDLVIGPTTPTAAFRLGEKTDDPLAMYLQDIFTVPANLAGIPAVSLPCGRDAEGLPLGFQLQANAFQESRLLQAAHAYQQATRWHLQRPTLASAPQA